MREEEKKRSSQQSNWNKFLKKRWIFPAIYLVSAALLITMIYWYQSSGLNIAQEPDEQSSDNTTGAINDQPVVEVNLSFENVSMPVENEDNVEIVTQFFDANASVEKQEAALIVDGNTYRPNLGLDIAMKDGTEFGVLASLSGKVAAVRQDSLLGNVIEIEHEKGVMTIYQSVKDFHVKAGDEVKQGQTIATSSKSQLNQAVDNHLHFEIRKDGVALNPLDFFGQPLTALHEDEHLGQVEKQDSSESLSDTEETNYLDPIDPAHSR